jgi:hypothetical protein
MVKDEVPVIALVEDEAAASCWAGAVASVTKGTALGEDEAVASCWAGAMLSVTKDTEAGASCWAPAGSDPGGGEAKSSGAVIAGSPATVVGEALASCWSVAGSPFLIDVEVVAVGRGAPYECVVTPSGSVHSRPRVNVDDRSRSSCKRLVEEY